MTPDERLKLLKELTDYVTAQVIDGLILATRACPNCAFWQAQTEQCHERTNCPQGPMRPPADIIAFGCNRFSERVPF